MEKTCGWMGSILRINLASGEKEKTGSQPMIEDFIGGRLLASRIYWDEVSPTIDAFDDDNALIIMPGPLAGTSAAACSRWVIAAKSPHSYPDQYGFGNCGGFLGAAIKRAGYDGLVINGKAKELSYVLIEDDKVQILDAKGLKGLTSDKTMEKLRQEHGADARTVCIGPAGENQVRFAIANSDQGGAISNGMGAVFGAKNLKAVVVRGSGKVPIAHPDKLKEINKRARFLREGLNDSLYATEPLLEGIEMTKYASCAACSNGCMRAYFEHTSGRTEIKKTCAAAFLYYVWDQKYHDGDSSEYPFIATSLCDQLGLCTGETSSLLKWLNAAFQQGLLTEEETGLPLSRIGSPEFFGAFVDMTVHKKGFGELLALGTRRAAMERGPEAEALSLKRIMPSGYANDSYGARLFLTNALFYATEPRNPIIQLHEPNFLLLKWVFWRATEGAMSPLDNKDLQNISERVWGSREAADFSTYDGKAKAAFMIQNRQHAKEAMVACDRYYPMHGTDQEDDHLGDPTLVPRFFEAVTGETMTMDDYYRTGERSVNLQRAIMGKEGRSGREKDALQDFNFEEPAEECEGVFGVFNPDLEFPGSGEDVVIRKGMTLDRDGFEKMKDEYYQLRGWDVASGLQSKDRLKELKLEFVQDTLDGLGIIHKDG
jgi:aldehyde:ferredoxin oxidoreductase